MDDQSVPSRDELLRAFLATHDAPCPLCGYNLRGVVLSSCPECDSPIALGVGPGRVRQGIWLAAMLAFAMAVGFDTVVGAMFTIAIIMTGGEDLATVFLFLSLILLDALCIFALWMFIQHRQGWLRMSRTKQYRWTVVVYIAVFLVHLSVPVGMFFISL